MRTQSRLSLAGYVAIACIGALAGGVFFSIFAFQAIKVLANGDVLEALLMLSALGVLALVFAKLVGEQKRSARTPTRE